ncbi:MAG: hypothetical protein MUF76_06850 [Hydrogenophaga sp.]|nr:hypothetical protein [Hydrogenophaga sp.]
MSSNAPQVWLSAAGCTLQVAALLRKALLVAASGVALSVPTSAAAQAVNEPREPALDQREQLERIEQWRREQERRAPLTREGAIPGWQPPLAGESPCFAVQSVRIVLAEPVAPAVREASQHLLGPVQDLRSFGGACLGAASLERLRNNLQDRLAARGYITSTLAVPPQDLRQGELVLLLQPGWVEAVAVEGARAAARPAANALALKPGDLLNLRDIEQTLENLGRLPSQSSRFVLEPGTAPGASVVRILPVQPDAAMWRLNLGAERPDGRDYGDVQFTGQVSIDHALRLGEQAGLWLAHSQGRASPGGARPQQTSWYAYLSVPVGRHVLSLSHSRADYRRFIAAGVGQFRDAGRDASSRLRWEWTFWRGEGGRAQAWAAASQRRARTSLDDIELISRRRLGTGVEQGLSLWGRAAPCDLSLELEGTQVQRLERDSDFQPPTDGLPRGWRTEILWACALGAGVDFSGQAYVQRVAQPVDGSDLLVLGTRQTVRAHAPADALTGRGLAVLRQEWLLPWLRIGAHAAVRPVLSLDWGRIHHPIDGGQTSRELAAVALGVRWQAHRASGQISTQYALRPTAAAEAFAEARRKARRDVRLQASLRFSL